jgi:ubiquinone/menaquinone biosynthesis C-methylase UbiE
MSFFEALFFAGAREWACDRAAGDVLEIGIGSGRNLPFYGSAVRLTGIDISQEMLKLAARRAEARGRKVELRLGDAQQLPFGDHTFDMVVSTFSLCSIPDDRSAVQEAARVLRPGGRFILVEHVRSPQRLVRAVQTLADWFSVRFAGDHQLREPLLQLKAAGLEVEYQQTLKLGIVQRIIARNASA